MEKGGEFGRLTIAIELTSGPSAMISGLHACRRPNGVWQWRYMAARRSGSVQSRGMRDHGTRGGGRTQDRHQFWRAPTSAVGLRHSFEVGRHHPHAPEGVG